MTSWFSTSLRKNLIGCVRWFEKKWRASIPCTFPSWSKLESVRTGATWNKSLKKTPTEHKAVVVCVVLGKDSFSSAISLIFTTNPRFPHHPPHPCIGDPSRPQHPPQDHGVQEPGQRSSREQKQCQVRQGENVAQDGQNPIGCRDDQRSKHAHNDDGDDLCPGKHRETPRS